MAYVTHPLKRFLPIKRSPISNLRHNFATAYDTANMEIREKTFTNWVISKLKKPIYKLEQCFATGHKLKLLIQNLSKRKIDLPFSGPGSITPKSANVQECLDFLRDKQGIDIGTLNSMEIANNNQKAVMDLIWALIIHYCISSPPWGEEFIRNDWSDPTKQLLNWIQTKIPEIPVENFTTTWNSGLAIAALVDAIAPGLVPDLEGSQDPIVKIKTAIDTAYDKLGISKLIEPADMINPYVDERIIFLYLCQFRKTDLLLNPTDLQAPLLPKVYLQRIVAYGPGITPHGYNCVGQSAQFIINTTACGIVGKIGDLEVKVLDPKKETLNCLVQSDVTKTFYNCSYMPTMAGFHSVELTFSGHDEEISHLVWVQEKPMVSVPNAPVVEVPKASHCCATGRGVNSKGIRILEHGNFKVHVGDSGYGVVDFTVVGPGEVMGIKSFPHEFNSGMYLYSYVPKHPGPHIIMVYYSGIPIPGSPFLVEVGDLSNITTRAMGSGLEGGVSGSPACFAIERNGQIGNMWDAKLNPPLAEIYKYVYKDGSYHASYIPPSPGEYLLEISVDNEHIIGSPFNVSIKPVSSTYFPDKVRVSGRGIQGVVDGGEMTFEVDVRNAGEADLEVKVVDNNSTDIRVEMHRNAGGVYSCKYNCILDTRHYVTITYGGVGVLGSPFRVYADPNHLVQQVVAGGKGLEEGKVDTISDFKLNIKEAEKDYLKIDFQGTEVPHYIKRIRDGNLHIFYWPTVPGELHLHITYYNRPIPNSPFKVNIAPNEIAIAPNEIAIA